MSSPHHCFIKLLISEFIHVFVLIQWHLPLRRSANHVQLEKCWNWGRVWTPVKPCWSPRFSWVCVNFFSVVTWLGLPLIVQRRYFFQSSSSSYVCFVPEKTVVFFSYYWGRDMRKGIFGVNTNSRDSDQPAEIYSLIKNFAILRYDLQ